MSFIAELRRRNVFRMAVLYLASAWLILQVADVLAGLFGLPDWTLRFVGFVLLLGFPLALVFSWIYELTPGGLKREKELARDHSTTARTGRKINIAIVVLLACAVGIFAFDRLTVEPSPPASPTRTDTVPDPGTQGQQRSVAVLPFANLSDDPEQVYFVDGLTEEIINRLAHIPELLVTARTSSFQFRDHTLGIPEIGDRLGVTHVVEGSVRRFGGQLRVTAQLIRASDGFHVWSENYDRQVDDLFQIQDDISQKIAAALDIYLDEEQREEIERIGTRNVEAFELWTRASQHFNAFHTQDDDAGLLKANRLLARAIELDPRFSAAYLFHADLFAHYLFEDRIRLPGNHPEGLTDEVAYRNLQDDLKRAEEYAVDEYAKTMTRVDRLFLSSNWNELPVVMNRLKELLARDDRAPGLNQWAEVIMTATGRTDSAVALTARNLQRNPLARFPYNEAAGALAHQGNSEAALELVERGRALTGDHPLFGSIEAKIHYFRKDPQAVLTALDRYEEKTNNEVFRIWAAGQLGRCEQARQSYAELIESSEAQDTTTLSWAHAWMGDMKSAESIVSGLDRSPVAAALFARAAWTFGSRTPWDPAIMPNVTRQFAAAGKTLVRDESFAPKCAASRR